MNSFRVEATVLPLHPRPTASDPDDRRDHHLGLIPLALGQTRIGGDGPPYFPMARAAIGSLAFSTVISLVVVPYVYVLLDRLRQWTSLVRARATYKTPPSDDRARVKVTPAKPFGGSVVDGRVTLEIRRASTSPPYRGQGPR